MTLYSPLLKTLTTKLFLTFFQQNISSLNLWRLRERRTAVFKHDTIRACWFCPCKSASRKLGSFLEFVNLQSKYLIIFKHYSMKRVARTIKNTPTVILQNKYYSGKLWRYFTTIFYKFTVSVSIDRKYNNISFFFVLNFYFRLNLRYLPFKSVAYLAFKWRPNLFMHV